MAFDQATRNRLQRFVNDARALLTREFTRQLQNDYGLDPSSGAVAELESMTHLDNVRRETGRILRVTLEHYRASSPESSTKDLLDRIIREQAFTVLNRLAALRMAEAREFLIESIASDYNSRGFQLYQRLAGTGLGETGEAYRCYLFSLFDEFALDLRVLFDRFSPMGRLFPSETELRKLLKLLNDPEIEPLWEDDEAIGWIYQYFNLKDERKKMRDESAAPRNSRELAVRNQFFTPRYVVEFLTDNTLGRIWYEMTQGGTRLKDQCRYLVRRPQEVFLTNCSPEEFNQRLREASDSLEPYQWLNVAGSVNGYVRRGDAREYSFWLEEMQQCLRANHDWEQISIQVLLDIMFGLYRKDYQSGGGTLDHSFAEIGQMVARSLSASAIENPSQEQLLRRPVLIPLRQIKDPREIRMLDPACGSMHFGLYAFDLYECIYEEAWDIEEQWGTAEFERDCSLKPLTETYESKEAFLQDVPRLIIEHNIHGIDIDPRAVQIAGLSLWLRAQRSWQGQGLKPAKRPQIRKSNIVCAEPMPGEERLLDEFIEQFLADTPEQRLVGQLVRRVFEAMKLAGEAGSLLQIEREISQDIEAAKLQWLSRSKSEQLVLPVGGAEPKQQELPLSVGDITDEYFWERVEGEIYQALSRYAEQADLSSAWENRYQRRLFANDTVRGFALIDLCQKRFDVALMNPPFGAGSLQTKAKLELAYPRTKNDLYGAFVERGLQLLGQRGQLGAITSRTGFFLSSFQKWREEILLTEAQPTVFADLGYGVLDAAMVETAAYCLSKEVS